jgi:class 3 adenylate cyclase
VTALFCDVVGSTPLGERLDAEVLRVVMRSYFEEMRVALDAHGGRVEKFIGDAVVGVFGVPVSHEDDALRAVRAAADMRGRLVELNTRLRAETDVELDAQIGLCTGEVVIGADGDLVLGDVGNTAARLQAGADPGGILIAASTFELVRDAVSAEPLTMKLKGKAAPVAAYRLISVDAGRPGHRREFDRPFVGRERELRLLRDAFERAVEERRCGLVTVLGLPGMGKSRLALELGRVMGDDVTVLVGHCLAYGEGITYAPLAAMVDQATDGRGVDGVRAVLESEDDGADVADRVAGVVGLAEMIGAGEEAFWATRRFFEGVAAAGPLLLVFEDIHWAQPTLLDLIEYLADWIRDRPVMVLCLARPELLESRRHWGGGRTNAVAILLEALPESDVGAMLADRLGSDALTASERSRILGAAQGVPLFVEQLAAMVRAGEFDATREVPPAIHALLSARLDALPAEECVLLEHAAVEGERFHAGGALALHHGDADAVVRNLDGLVRRELLRPDRPDVSGERGYRFSHALIRDVAYGRVSKAQRAVLHEHLAGWLEGHGGEADVIGYHLEQAYRASLEVGRRGELRVDIARRAADFLGQAGRKAHRRGDAATAADLIRRAVDLRPAGDPERLELLHVLGELLSDTDMAGAERALSEAITGAASVGNREVEWDGRVVLLRLELYRDPTARPLPDVLAETNKAIGELTELGAESAVGSALVLRYDAEWMQGRLDGFADLVAALTAASPTVALRLCGYAGGGICLGSTPASDGARICGEISAKVPDNRLALSVLRSFLGVLQAMQGEIEAGRATAHFNRDSLAEFGNLDWSSIATLSCGYVDLLGGDPERAEREFAHAATTFDEIGDTWFLSTAVVDRAIALCLLGRYAEAADACDHPRAPYDAEWVIKWNRAHALVQTASGSLDKALDHANAAVSAAAPTHYLWFHADALVDRARIHDLAGRPADARADLVAAERLYARKGHLVGRDRVSGQRAERD